MVMQMKKKGMSENEIINVLRNQGVSPKGITDALSQAQIKSAINNESYAESNSLDNEEIPSPQQQPQAETSETQYTPQVQQTPGEYVPPAQPIQPMQQEYAPQQEAYQQDPYIDYSPSGGIDTESMIEVAEQVFSEKIKKIEKQLNALNEFKTLSQTKIENISERLKKIESTIDRLQIAILEKIGSYGRNIESIKKEMSMMQDSFGKVINPLLDEAERRLSDKSKKHTHRKKSS